MGQGCYSCETSITSEVADKMVMMKEKEKSCETLKTSTSANPELAGKVVQAVGFSSITRQIQRKEFRKAFRFKLMVVGKSGLGKSTFINTLFLTDIYLYKELPKIVQTLQIETKQVELEENGVKLHLTIVDTPGFGDLVDNSEASKQIIDYVDKGFQTVLESELSLNIEAKVDMRVDACLYFIAPTGHGLKALDIQVMKKLDEKVNIIPVIAKADAFTKEELGLFKQNILKQIIENSIRIYNFPKTGFINEDCMREKQPFAIVGCNAVVKDANGGIVKGRKYPWGTVDVENEDHSDYLALKDLLLSSHLYNLKDITRNIVYETYRSKALSALTLKGNSTVTERLSLNPYILIEEEKKIHDKKMKDNEEEMEEVFCRKVHEKEEKHLRWQIQESFFVEKEQEDIRKEKEMIEFDKEQLRKDKLAWENENKIKLAKVNTLPAGGCNLVKTRSRFGFPLGTWSTLGFGTFQNRN